MLFGHDWGECRWRKVVENAPSTHPFQDVSEGRRKKRRKRDCPDGGDASHLFQFIIGNTVMCLGPQINQSLCGASHSYLTASFS